MPHHILHAPSGYGPSAKHYLIFFITGNPGLIAYYNTFLATLNHLLSPAIPNCDSAGSAFHIFGQSLPGFEDEDDTVPDHSGPYGLQEVIDLTFNLLVSQRISSGDRKGESFDGIILIGHSVGSYILLELLRKIREKSFSKSLNVKAGVLLFATVMELAQSSNGIKFRILFRIPEFPRVFSILVRGLFWPLPRVAVKWLVKTVTRMPEDVADVTTNLLVGKRALWQAL
jgi:pimeloyl-ACP methyl ester carboxylesterase